ncbi:MAG: hypothetical protein DRH12_17365, partial [Deltaproteobacteria bacterium]
MASVPKMKKGSVPINIIIQALENDDRVIFAYLYGSATKDRKAKDIDIAVYTKGQVDPNQLSADLKIS